MFRVPCPMCQKDVKALIPQSLTCKECGHKFKPTKARMYFKVRCGHCKNVIEQPAKNIGQNAVCPVCCESSMISAPPKYAEYLEKLKAKKEADKERRKAERARKRGKKAARRGGLGRGVSRKREAVRRATGQPEDEIVYECAFCGAGISKLNIDREEAAEHQGLWYCWDHVPQK